MIHIINALQIWVDNIGNFNTLLNKQIEGALFGCKKKGIKIKLIRNEFCISLYRYVDDADGKYPLETQERT